MGGSADSKYPVEQQSTRVTCFMNLFGPMDFTRVYPQVLLKEGGDMNKMSADVFCTVINGTPA